MKILAIQKGENKMQYTTTYQSSVGGILLAADEIGLTGLWFNGEKYYADSLDPEHEEKELPVFGIAKRWLDIYFPVVSRTLCRLYI